MDITTLATDATAPTETIPRIDTGPHTLTSDIPVTIARPAPHPQRPGIRGARARLATTLCKIAVLGVAGVAGVYAGGFVALLLLTWSP